MSNKRKIAAIALVICLAAAGWSGYMGISELLERKSGTDYYAGLAASVRAVTPEPTATPTEVPAPEGELSALVEPTLEPTLDFDSLRVEFPDLVGWIRIDDTSIDYPVVQGIDNDFYLTHLPNKEKNSSGSIMMDAACDPTFGSAVTILHGHHMRSGAMFGDLDLYLEEGYYENHPVIRLSTPEMNCDVEIFCVTIVDGRTYGYETSFEDEQAFTAFMEELTQDNAIDAEYEIAFGDRLLMLSTCDYSYEDARLLVVGRILADQPE